MGKPSTTGARWQTSCLLRPVELLCRGLVSLLSVVVASSVACSSHEQRPAQIGDCMGSAHACLNSGVVGSSSGSSADASADGGGCGLLTFVVETCQTCVEKFCCSLV